MNRLVISLLPNPEFLKWLIAAIAKARRSVIVVNYLATLEQGGKGPVALIVKELGRAGKRGVNVEVVLEGSKFRENYAFYRFLKDAGADVWMDTSLTFIHTKAVLIDDRLLCVGSHNLSASALTSHHEMSAAFSDKKAIQGFQVELGRMTEQKRRIESDTCREGTSLPLSVIFPLIRIKRSISPDAYLLYLLLCRLDGGRPRPIRIDASSWVNELGLPPSTASANVRIAAMLELMDRKLGVVKYDRKNETARRCYCEERSDEAISRKLLAPRDCHAAGPVLSEVEGRLAMTPRGSLFIPSTFWKYGWHRRLSVAAIHLYLAGEAERQWSPFAPWWRLRRDAIAAKYGFQKQLVNRAQMELKRAGLLEILFEAGMAPKGKFARYMNYFRQNPFYDRAALEEKICSLSRHYTPKVFAAAGLLLAAVCEDSDLEKMTALCEALSKRGLAAAKRVLTAIRRLSPNSTKRSFEYITELLDGRNVAIIEEG